MDPKINFLRVSAKRRNILTLPFLDFHMHHPAFSDVFGKQIAPRVARQLFRVPMDPLLDLQWDDTRQK